MSRAPSPFGLRGESVPRSLRSELKPQRRGGTHGEHPAVESSVPRRTCCCSCRIPSATCSGFAGSQSPPRSRTCVSSRSRLCFRHPVIWGGMFMFVDLYQIARIYLERRPVVLSPDEHSSTTSGSRRFVHGVRLGYSPESGATRRPATGSSCKAGPSTRINIPISGVVEVTRGGSELGTFARGQHRDGAGRDRRSIVVRHHVHRARALHQLTAPSLASSSTSDRSFTASRCSGSRATILPTKVSGSCRATRRRANRNQHGSSGKTDAQRSARPCSLDWSCLSSSRRTRSRSRSWSSRATRCISAVELAALLFHEHRELGGTVVVAGAGWPILSIFVAALDSARVTKFGAQVRDGVFDPVGAPA